MTFKIIPFEPAHIQQLDVQDAQRLTDDEQARADFKELYDTRMAELMADA